MGAAAKLNKKLINLQKDFYSLRSSSSGKDFIINLLKKDEESDKYLSKWYQLSKQDGEVYPSQGLIKTPYDYLDYQSSQMLPTKTMTDTLRLRRFFLEMFNHPLRMYYLNKINSEKFIAPPNISIRPIDQAIKMGLSLSVGDIGSSIVGTDKERISRTQRYAQGPFVKLGKQARSIFMGSSSPDVWNSAPSIATMAASHCLAAIPRNGVTHDPKRQADLAKETFKWLRIIEEQILKGRPDRAKIANYWKNNIVGTLEARPDKALRRARLLYKNGVRVFRPYSPEPGSGLVKTIKALRKEYKDKIEIIGSIVVDVNQAKKVQEVGADSLIVGVGGGGRCITGVRSGSAVEWPKLVYQLRGKINIPVIVEGGASDHIAITLLLGASGISVSRIVSGGSIESPGGALFYSDSKGKLFKPYGGEASPRTKFLDGKLLPFDIPSFVEGETTKAYLNFGMHAFPTLTYNLHILMEDAVLTLVFRGVKSIQELHHLNPSPIKRITSEGNFQRNTH